MLAGGCTSTLARFERTLAAQDSATAALGEWCAAQALATPPLIRAERIGGAADGPTAQMRALLAVPPGERLALRHVRLSCGGVVLSEAWNWYVPARLPDTMNARLDRSDTPFGKVIAPLGFKRQRLASQRGAAADCPAGTTLSHRAVLRLPEGLPVSVVTECYTRANLRTAGRQGRAPERKTPQ